MIRYLPLPTLLVCALALVGLLTCTPPVIQPPPPVPTGTPLSIPAGSYQLPITNLVVAPDGALWYSYGNLDFHPAGGGVRRLVQGQETHFGKAAGLPNENAQVLAVAPDGVLWVGAGCTLTRYPNQTWQIIARACGRLGGKILDLAFTADGAVWAATGFSLDRFDGQRWAVTERLINALAVAPDGTLWASGWEGAQDSWFVARLQDGTWQTFNTVNAIGASVGQIVIAPDGALWGIAGTEKQTVVRFDGQRWTRYPIDQRQPSGYLSGLTVAPNGELWTISDGNVVHFDGQRWQMPLDLPTGVSALAFAPEGTLWLASQQGITHYAGTSHSHP
jgi:ligand-binding sensor domain-containing protein